MMKPNLNAIMFYRFVLPNDQQSRNKKKNSKRTMIFNKIKIDR